MDEDDLRQSKLQNKTSGTFYQPLLAQWANTVNNTILVKVFILYGIINIVLGLYVNNKWKEDEMFCIWTDFCYTVHKNSSVAFTDEWQEAIKEMLNHKQQRTEQTRRRRFSAT